MPVYLEGAQVDWKTPDRRYRLYIDLLDVIMQHQVGSSQVASTFVH